MTLTLPAPEVVTVVGSAAFAAVCVLSGPIQAPTTVVSVDYLHVLTMNGWRTLQINPLVDHDNNAATPRVRARIPGTAVRSE